MKVSDIQERTRRYINEYVGSTERSTFEDETDEQLLVYIDAAARLVAQVAPNRTMSLTETTLESEWQERADGRWMAIVSLPADYLRMEKMTCKGLKRPITRLLQVDDPKYGEQQSAVTGIGAGEYSPLAFRVDDEVEIHSWKSIPEANSLPTAIRLKYVEVPKVAKEGNPAREQYDAYPTLRDVLLDVVSAQAAALYLSLTGDENAKAAQEAAAAMLQAIGE